MRLTDLKPRLLRYSEPKTFAPVGDVADADCVLFLCPACFAANSGPVGTHSIRIDFVGRGVPDEYCIRNSSGTPVRWDVTGDTLESLTLSPSIQVLGTCNWHGFVKAGGIE